MASKEPEYNIGNTDTEEETIAQRKKRRRRVSFAETTAVRFFDRDDECETPEKQSSSAEGSALRRTESEEIRELLRREGCGGDENEDGEGDEDVAVRNSFFRPIESPSSGSGFGSATSNDEDNFFGPVSTDFIKPGRLSDSVASEEHHDVTMDSTAFSMHFRSLARSESGGDIKTPSGVGEKTPTQTTSNPGNVMVLTRPKNMIPRSPLSVRKNSEGGDSNDMSFVGDSQYECDYGRLSPELDALLAGGNKRPGDVSPCDQFAGSSLTACLEGNQKHPTNIHRHGSSDVADTDRLTEKPPWPTDLVSSSNVSIDEASGSLKFSNAGQGAQDAPFIKDLIAIKKVKENQNITPLHKKGDPILGYRESITGASGQASKQSTGLVPANVLSKLSAEQDGSPLIGSISSLEHKKMKIFSSVINSSVKQRDSAKLKKGIGSLHMKENGKDIQSLPSFSKSASRFQTLETFSLSLKDRIRSSRLASSPYLTKYPVNTNALASNNSQEQMRQMNLPVVCLEEQFSTVSKDIEGPRGMGRIPSDEYRPSKQATNISENREAPHNTTASLLVDSSEEHLDSEASLSHFHSSDAKEPDNFLSTENEGCKNINAMRSDSSLFNAALNDRKDTKDSNSLEYRTSHLGNPNQPHNLDAVGHSIGRVGGASSSILQTVNGGLLVDQREGATSSSLELDWSDITGENDMLLDETMLINLPSHFESSGSLQTFLRNERSDNYITSNTTVLARLSPYTSVKKFSQEQMFPDLTEKLCHQPSAKQSDTLADKDNMLPLETTDAATSKVDNCYDGIPNSLKKSNYAYSSGVKRKSEELVEGIEKASNTSLPVQNLLEDQGCVSVSQNASHQQDDTLVQKIGCGKRMKLDNDMLNRLNQHAQSLFSSSDAKLNTQVVTKLVDIVSRLQKYKANQVLSEMWCQRVSDGVSYSHIKRVAEIKSLLYKTLYEKVKLRLMHEKQDILQRKTQLLQSAMKECEELKPNCNRILNPGQINHPCDSRDPEQWVPDYNSANEEAQHNHICTLLDSREDSEKRIETLIKSFHSSFKIKGELNCKETIEYVKAHLKRKASCLYLHQELQSWEVDSLASGAGYFTVALKYGGFIYQRFNKRNSRIAIQSELNDVKILKTWPNIDACAAFKFVLTGETTLKYTGPSILAQETQRMSSLLGNLHDVLDEVKQAQIEIMNLVELKFCSPSAMKLDLGLTFMDFGAGRRVMLKLDLSSLNCGIYPLEIMPYEVVEVGDRISGKQKPISKPTLADIQSALGGLKCGHLKILRLCRCVSNMLSSN